MPREQEPLSILGGDIEIIGDDNRTLFSVRPLPDGAIEISTGLSCVRHNDVILDSSVGVFPQGNGTVVIRRSVYEGK